MNPAPIKPNITADLWKLDIRVGTCGAWTMTARDRLLQTARQLQAITSVHPLGG